MHKLPKWLVEYILAHWLYVGKCFLISVACSSTNALFDLCLVYEGGRWSSLISNIYNFEAYFKRASRSIYLFDSGAERLIWQ